MSQSSLSHPLVSIVAACYNHARFLEETLDSIAAQTYPNIELIITDDGSKDDSISIIGEWMQANPQANATLIANPQNEGICKTFNKGLRQSHGKYFQVIACDDVMLPHKIETQVAALEAASLDICMVHSDAHVMNEKSQTIHDSFWDFWDFQIPTAPTLLEQLIEQNTILAPSVLLRREVVVAEGGYDENLCYEDWDLWLRLAQKYTFFKLPNPLVYYRHFSTSTSQGTTYRLAIAQDSIRLLDKHRGISSVIDQRLNKAQRRYITTLIQHNVATTRILWKKWCYEKTAYSLYMLLCSFLGLSNERAHAIKYQLKKMFKCQK